MGCKINVIMELGEETEATEAVVRFKSSQVRTKRGYWVKFPYKKGGIVLDEEVQEVVLRRGQSYNGTFEFRQKCGKKRRYRIFLKWKEPGDDDFRSTTINWPSNSTYDESNCIMLGDLNEYI